FDHSAPQIKGKSSSHENWPPSPALTVNQKTPAMGIPYDSATDEYALGRSAAEIGSALTPFGPCCREPNSGSRP
ncbi:MAG: hypothetical protein RIC54_02445, partial [Thalassobaculum sp.]|uniref:hypothetical protein n=1 Tax=Thalassobaculum sp. TaxID=2022740 RepID=UPI0032EFA306